jgi:hypothetical protein
VSIEAASACATRRLALRRCHQQPKPAHHQRALLCRPPLRELPRRVRRQFRLASVGGRWQK